MVLPLTYEAQHEDRQRMFFSTTTNTSTSITVTHTQSDAQLTIVKTAEDDKIEGIASYVLEINADSGIKKGDEAELDDEDIIDVETVNNSGNTVTVKRKKITNEMYDNYHDQKRIFRLTTRVLRDIIPKIIDG